MRRRQILKATGAVLAAPVLAQLARPFDQQRPVLALRPARVKPADQRNSAAAAKANGMVRPT